MFGSPPIHCQPARPSPVDGRRARFRGCSPPRCFRRDAVCAVSKGQVARSRPVPLSASATCPGLREASPGAVVALRFAHPVDDLIRELKYRGVIANARVLGVLLAQAVRRMRGVDCRSCWCPCRCTTRGCASAGSTRPRRSRGTPDGCSEFPVARSALRRVRDTPSQTSLECERAPSQRARCVRRDGARASAQVVRGRSRRDRRRRGDDRQHGGGARACCSRRVSAAWMCGRWRGRARRCRPADAQASPASSALRSVAHRTS